METNVLFSIPWEKDGSIFEHVDTVVLEVIKQLLEKLDLVSIAHFLGVKDVSSLVFEVLPCLDGSDVDRCTKIVYTIDCIYIRIMDSKVSTFINSPSSSQSFPIDFMLRVGAPMDQEFFVETYWQDQDGTEIAVHKINVQSSN